MQMTFISFYILISLRMSLHCKLVPVHHREYEYGRQRAAILMFQNNDTVAMLVYQTNPLGVQFFSYVNTFFCTNKFALPLDTASVSCSVILFFSGCGPPFVIIIIFLFISFLFRARLHGKMVPRGDRGTLPSRVEDTAVLHASQGHPPRQGQELI